MKHVALLLLWTGFFALAQETDDPARPSLGKTGQIFTIKYTPKAKRIEVGLAGTPAASVDPDRFVLLGRVFPAKGSPKELRVKAMDDHFTVLDSVDENSEIEIEVKDPKTKRSEKFKLQPNP